MGELHALPLADAAPSLDAVVTRDLRARRHGAEIRERVLGRLLDEAIDLQPPVDEAVLRHRDVVGIVGRCAAVRPEFLARCRPL